ncbi:CHAT domain-containing protein [Pontibacter sp. 13R65]|uniref:CHAT domain-containing protein n=1 Tax=Pontibacter sp. 13R65 TaxID=3127458 RepID=UPI00301DEFEB
MEILKIKIPGTRVDNTPTDNTQELLIEETFLIGSTTRGEYDSLSSSELDENKVVEFVFDDDTVWFGDNTTLDEIFPGTSAQLRRSENEIGEKALIIPTELYVDEQSRSGIFSKITLKLVKIFTKRTALSPLVKKLAGELEEKLLAKRSGLYKLTSEFGFEQQSFDIVGRYLLFLHGTASSTTGSFRELKGTATWKFIHQTFKNNVLAFEHETLTKSPLQNVLELVSQLPQQATFTIISHSRGGLVGDILNRFCTSDSVQRGFSAKEKNYLRKHKRESDLQLIEEIEKAILGKDITIDKFIRVACTASGTTLASRRLDIYFNVIFNVIGIATGQSANPIYMAFKDLIAALIESKDDASVLPGLEVQNPRSPFNQMLNNANPDITVNTPLIIISGDAKMSLRWQALKVLLSNLFFWDDNDFVVDTRSMYNGAKRAPNTVQYFFDEGVAVSHFNYFKNDKTQNALLLALQNSDHRIIPGFSKLETRAFTEEEIRNINFSLPGGKVYADTVTGKKPIVVLLPGIMGSTLSVSDKLIWINFLGFVAGSLTRLQHNPDNKNVKADGLVGSSYKKLTEYLKRDYDVVTFPFDWRTHMVDSAASLSRKIEQLMEYGQPIKLIGHSMGGVLIRDFMINHESTWRKLKASKDFRLVFLGSPLGGSFRIPYVLFGLDSIIKKLDFIDFDNSQKDLIEIFCKFPGLLSLLPLTTDDGNDFSKQETWNKMRGAFGDNQWPIPDQDVLDQFKAYREQVLQNASTVDYGQAVYIAGQGRRGSQTISGYQITEKNNKSVLEFRATREGDESVTWDSGIPKTMLAQNTVYYSDVTHGELANDPKLFGAIADLLSNGSTTQLKRTRPVVRSLEKEFRAKEVFDFDLSPEGVERTILGLESESRFISGDVPITVLVSNGDMKYAMYPLMVGHFEKDGILFAEKAIDSYLGGELSRRHQLGLYPGDIGTNEIVTTTQARGFKGAIIVGLGRQGLLTEHHLAFTVEQGVVRYLANLNTRTDSLLTNGQKTKRIGLSALLIGSHYGGLSIESSIRAIIQGVQNANAKVRKLYSTPKTIDTIEFGELYKDRALACVKAINSIERDEAGSLNIITNGDRIKENIGWRERLPMDGTREWWTRINVRRYTDEELGEDKQRNILRFAISTDAARVEERTLTTINDTLTEMLDDLSRKDEWSPELAKSIFELMIPNDFKDQVKRQSNINWILDNYTAAFPWELLQDSITNSRPLSVNAGMIRQLATEDYRISVTPVVERTAIVVGDPDLKNPAIQLPAAFTEGEKVAEFLSTQGFDVTQILNGTAAQILSKLFNKNYKIVHLAGHGIFNSGPDRLTGMLIGPNAILTPAYIDQMSNVPELVFVNCCYLGQTDGAAEEFTKDRFRLAANIGTQLIKIGVKAVVAAGWAVNDSAALEFAERFYDSMFEGCSFGEAIKKARKKVFETYGPRNNTWGAYQCYGDPFYKLSGNTQEDKVAFDFIIADEAEIELSNLLNKVARGGYDPEVILQTMDAIDSALAKANIRSGRIIELQAFLYSSLNKYELALAKFEELWKEEKASFSFSATEKYCNIQIKFHAQKVKEAGLSNQQVVQDAIIATKEAIAKLESLKSFGETVERSNLLGSAYKRLAMISQGQEKQAAYECAASYYRKAYESTGNKAKYYPLTNWLSIENALVLAGVRSWGKDPLPKKKNALEALGIELQNTHLKEDQEREYWDWIAEANLLLCLRLLGDRNVTYDSIVEQYTSAWAMIGSEGQRQAEIEHLESLKDALTMGENKSRECIEIVERLIIDLEVLV